ncbi:hypothetical protein [Treponema zioleckii]|uniref:hypothetical protein n=1 Tax=Treponema zioleckii TaxID=331680 RepID=UPI00168A5CF1|nr:hypothetical protein [Treponema zioleckii]
MNKKNVLNRILLLLATCMFFFGCASVSSSDGTVAEGFLADGAYFYEFERITELVQSETLYKASGVDYSLLQVENASDEAIFVKENSFLEPEFFEDLALKIDSKGNIFSPTNPTVSGKYSDDDGAVLWSGIFSQRGQNVMIIEEGFLVKVEQEYSAPKSLEGKYEISYNGEKFDLLFKDGIAFSNELGMFIVGSEGGFSSSYKVKIERVTDKTKDTYIPKNSFTHGKLKEDGTIEIEISNAYTKINLSGKKILDADISGEDSAQGSSLKKLRAIVSQSKDKKATTEEGKPEWFNEKTSFDGKKLTVSAKGNAKDKKTAAKIAEYTAAAQLAAQKTINVRKSKQNEEKSLLEVFRSQILNEESYKTENFFADKATKTFYISISAAAR